MIELEVKKTDGSKAEDIEVSEGLLGEEFHNDLLYRAVRIYRNNGRSGTASTKSKADVTGSNRKPWRQKGTGRARVGSRASPLWRSGGVIFGPKPKEYNKDLPKKMKRKAFASALSTRYEEGNICVVEGLEFDAPKTKEALLLLASLELPKDTLIICSQVEDDWKLRKSFSNIPTANCISTSQANVYEVLKHEGILLTKSALTDLEERIVGQATGV
ncbi:MAG: 50S ribosomal protein L4 [Candidatus Acetothermia bacterium]|nr:50S ribosomal protein L4 [Candidatus Bipolaricaulota bacterium]